jgi:hypothetical protein
VRRSAIALSCCIAVLPITARAKDQLSPDAHIEIATQPPNATPGRTQARAPGPEPADLGETPLPVRPRHKGLVLESTLGLLGFVGQFRHVAPSAYWMHTQLGYELLTWLMLFGEAELAFTDTSEAQDATHSRAFPMWGLGGGARVTFHVKDFAAFVQGHVGALTASVPHDALVYLGFRNAESLGVQFGGRVGAEWYQRDRHFALCIQSGVRDAQGFSKSGVSTDIPIMWDVAVGLRYSF